MADIKLEAGVKLPGEDIVVALLNFVTRNRETMSQENRDKWDAAGYAAYRAWNNAWVKIGWPGEPLP